MFPIKTMIVLFVLLISPSGEGTTFSHTPPGMTMDQCTEIAAEIKATAEAREDVELAITNCFDTGIEKSPEES